MNRQKLGWIETEIDDLDWKLLDLVQANARQSFAALGRQLSLSAPAVAERMLRLEDRGLIRGYYADIDPVALNLGISAFIEVRVKRSDYPRFQASIKSLNWVLESYHVAGRAAFMLKVALPNIEALEMLIGHLSQYGETTTSLILSTAISRRLFRRTS